MSAGCGVGGRSVRAFVIVSLEGVASEKMLVVKLPRARVDELIDAGAGAPFNAGKASPMTQWLTVFDEHISTWFELAQEALHFVRQS